MPNPAKSSSSPAVSDRLKRVPLAHLIPHPANANVMDPEVLETLARNITRNRRYPPLVVRPHPGREAHWQILDGHQRAEALRRLGYDSALCFEWPCDDATALLLLATLNRLAGDDVPAKRSTLLEALTELVSIEELSALLPEDAAGIEQTIQLTNMDTDALLAELEAAATRTASMTPRTVTIAVDPHEETLIESAITAAQQASPGRVRRGEALATVCGQFLETPHA